MEKQTPTVKDPAPLLLAIRQPSTGFVVIATTLLFMASVIVFVFATLASQRDHDKRFALAQRQVNGDQAMIYAVCTAFHKRDLSDAKKWASLTKIELYFKRPNNNAIDAAYHAARRKVLKESAIADQNLIHFNCLGGMEKAYHEGADSKTYEPSDRKWNLRFLSR